jgi:hypothetical protein
MKRGTILAVLERVTVRNEILDGKSYLVAPVVLLADGVHHGTGGAVYYPPDVLESYVETWNGVPLPVEHPVSKTGDPLSANSPEVENKQNIGRLYGVYYDSGNKKIRGEVWIDVDKAGKVQPAVLSLIRNGGHLEVSTGMYFTTDNTSGKWNGEAFDGTVVDMRPDHLALLPNDEGACNWADGCGVRNNKSERAVIEFDDAELAKLNTSIGESLENVDKDKGSPLLNWLVENVKGIFRKIWHNEMSHDDVRDAVRAALKDSIPGKDYIWVKEMFDSNVIYEISDMDGGSEQMWKRSYSIDKGSGKVTLGDDTVEVKEETKYVPVVNAGAESEPADNKSVNVKEDVMKVEEMVTALIANDQTKYTDEDKEWLSTLSESQLEKMELKEDEKPIEAKPEANDAGDDPPVADEKPATVEEYIANAPPEIQAVLNRSVARDKEIKAQLVKGILDNKSNKFTEVRLNVMSIDDLIAVTELSGNAVEANYELRGGGNATETNEDDKVPEPLKAFGANSVSEERAKAK